MIMTHPNKASRKQRGITVGPSMVGLAMIILFCFLVFSRETMESLSIDNGLATDLPESVAGRRHSMTSTIMLAHDDNDNDNNDKMTAAFHNAPIGSLGAKGTQRENYKYYDSLFFVAMQFGRDAKTVLEVGCSNDPFAKYLTWMEQRLCVAPYVISYEKARVNTLASNVHGDVDFVKADFMEWEAPSDQEQFDVVICGQVLEHVPDPAKFLRKLIRTAKVATIVSVPYKWNDCGKNCHHLHHQIGMHTVLEWAGKENKPVYQSIVTESNGYARLIMVF